jgi:trigger factor
MTDESDTKSKTSAFNRISVKPSLPEVGPIDLSGLEVTVEAPLAPTTDDVVNELKELHYRAAARSPLKLGEPVGEDDEVNIDVLGFTDGALVPFSIHEGLTIGPGHERGIEGLHAALFGQAVGTSFFVHLTIPQSHPVVALRGKPILFTVRMHGASHLMAAALDSTQFLEDAKLGSSLDEVMEKLADGFMQAQTFRAQQDAHRRVLAELARRAKISVSQELIDCEIGKRWRVQEGRLLARLNITKADQEAALGRWLDEPQQRVQTQQGIEAALVLRAVALQEKLTDAEGLRSTLDQFFGDAAPRVREGFRQASDAELNQRAVESLIALRASELIWSRVAVKAAATRA